MELRIDFRLAYIHLTMIQGKCQGQGQAHINSEYVENGERSDKY